jgi:divalent metal cation (Fe/Co/Zn/Cd) transporter
MTPPVELPSVHASAGAAPTGMASGGRPAATFTRARYEQLAGRVKLLSWLSLAWMSIEGAVAIAAGIVAGSIALIGFGLDSAIEGFASVIIIWRFTGHRVFSHAAEQRAQKLVAVQFFLLAPYVGFEAVKALVGGEHPDISWVGIGLAIGSVIFMPMLGIAKQRLADQLGSAATAGEGRQNMLCAYLAGALLVGLLGNALAGAWWLDPAVGLLIAGVALTEGVEAWQGEGCCVSSPLDGVGFADDTCHDGCCPVQPAVGSLSPTAQHDDCC